MLDEFDYKEPTCSLCGGREFYNPKPTDPLGTIPVARIIDRVDEYFAKNNLEEAKRLLEYWQKEAVALRDLRGELSIDNELVGLYRKLDDKQSAMETVDRTLELVTRLGLDKSVSGGTIYLNCATDLKAFDLADKAMPLYLKAQAIYTQFLDKNDEQFAGLYNNMALTYVDLKEYQRAEDAYHMAIDIKLKHKDGELDGAITYVNLAHLYEKWDKNDKIAHCLNKAKDLLSTTSLAHNGYYAFVISKCAPSFEYFGMQEYAKELEKMAEDIYERA